MIRGILVFNNHGKPRLIKFYEHFVSCIAFSPLFAESVVHIHVLLCRKKTYSSKSFAKHSSWCLNATKMSATFLRVAGQWDIFYRHRHFHGSQETHFFSLIGGSDYKLIYRHYATLYFVFCVDSSESELGILDLIQVLWIWFTFGSWR